MSAKRTKKDAGASGFAPPESRETNTCTMTWRSAHDSTCTTSLRIRGARASGHGIMVRPARTDREAELELPLGSYGVPRLTRLPCQIAA